jgi:hypothetical protein
MIVKQAARMTALMVAIGAPLSAHHSLTEYDLAGKLTLSVTVREFHFVNPHPYLVVESGDRPLTQVWRLELDNRFELVQIGMTADTFGQGDRLLVSGAPGRNRKTILYVRELDRPADGFRYEQPSSTPRIVRPAQGNNR